MAVALLAGGCRKENIIPDDVLADIFHDAFLVNAYTGVKRVNLDSLQIYEPIAARYGYKLEDIRATIGNFSRRKSARLGTVVEKAISRLEAESKIYAQKVVILDTVRNASIRALTQDVYCDSLIEARLRSDSTLLELVVEPVHPGEYNISYNYDCKDKLDKHPRKAIFYFETEHGGRFGYSSARLRDHENVRRVIRADKRCRRLIIKLGEYDKKERPKRQDLTIRKLRVKYTPTEEMAIDSLFRQYVDVRIFTDEFLFPQADSLALPADTTRVAAQPAS